MDPNATHARLKKLLTESAVSVTSVFTEMGLNVNHATNHVEHAQDLSTINVSHALMSH